MPNSQRFFNSVGGVVISLIFYVPVIGLLLVLLAIELGVFARVCKEAFEWGYALLF